MRIAAVILSGLLSSMLGCSSWQDQLLQSSQVLKASTRTGYVLVNKHNLKASRMRCQVPVDLTDDPVYDTDDPEMVDVSLALLQKIDKGCIGRMLKKTTLMSGFRETSHCIVEGHVYAMPGEHPDFKRADYCREIQSEVKDNALFLYSPHTWVAIELPQSGGYQRLLYKWGSDWAHIGPTMSHVAYGQIVKS